MVFKKKLMLGLKDMRKKEKIKRYNYKPTNIKSLLEELWENSEYVVDMAYSSLIFGTNHFSSEVMNTVEYINNNLYSLRETALLAARNVEDAESLTGVLNVASSMEKIVHAAKDISRLSMEFSGRTTILPGVLKEADEVIETVKVLPESGMCGKSIGELKIESRTGIRVIAIRRKRKWIFNANENHNIIPYDLLLIRGFDESIENFRAYASGESAWELSGGDESE